MLDRKSAPPFADLIDFHLPTPSVEALNDKVNFIHLDQVQQDVVKIEVVFKSGKWVEPALGISQFTAQLLDKGTSNKNAHQIAEHFDLLGASIEVSPGFDYTSISLYCLKNRLAEALPLFCEITTTPIFPDSELALLKTLTIQNLKVSAEKTSYLASKKFRQVVFGIAHPYGSSLEPHHINSISREQLMQFFSTQYELEEVYAIGSLDTPMLKFIKDSFQPYGNKLSQSPNYISLPKDSESQKSIYQEKSGSLQTSIRLGKKIINRHHPDYPIIVLLNHILGGYFGSRLMKNIREEKGLTYGINSSVSALKHDALFIIGTDVNKSNHKYAIEEIEKEIQNLATIPIEDYELELAKNHLLGGLQLETANTFSIMDKIKVIRLNQLNPEFYSNLFATIRQIQSMEIQRVAHQYLALDQLTEVSVG